MAWQSFVTTSARIAVQGLFSAISEEERVSWMAGQRNSSAGMRILAALPPQLRTAAIVGGLAEIAGTGIAAYGTHDVGWRFVFIASVALIGAVFVPRRR